MADPVNTMPGLSLPTRRRLKAFAFDPSRGRLLGNEMELAVRFRKLAPGPTELDNARDRIAVVDYDASCNCYYRPVDLDHPFVLGANGMNPSEADPRFHQQMLYAVASDTIEQFENALGRRIHWRRAERAPEKKQVSKSRGWKDEDILTLTLFPHAMLQANAFYSPDAHGILFGYFRASGEDVGSNLPGQTVFTCLSHDIIVHELTHAILDGLRRHFMEQTNPDVAAFHEAFADLIALFRHFTHREVLLDAIQRTGGRLYDTALKGNSLADEAANAWLAAGYATRNPLIELAGQFGEATGLRRGLRSAIGRPKTMNDLRNVTECHERGSVLVAAVFDAFFTIYIQRAAAPFRIYRSAGGVEREDLPAPLADAICEIATRTAKDFFNMCVRALDFLPPVDLTFGDFLRAVLTAHKDFDPVDEEGVREAWMQAFRHRAILPEEAPSFSVEGLCWPTLTENVELENLPFGGPFGLTYPEQERTAKELLRVLDAPGVRNVLQLDPNVPITFPSFHPVYRVDRKGSIRWDLVVEVVQTQEAKDGGYPKRGGTTLVISTPPTAGATPRSDKAYVRYAIAKPIFGPAGAGRSKRQDGYFTDQEFKPGLEFDELRVNFALVHSEGP